MKPKKEEGKEKRVVQTFEIYNQWRGFYSMISQQPCIYGFLKCQYDEIKS